MVQAFNSDRAETLVRLMTMDTAGNRVEDLSTLAKPHETALSTSTTGSKWLFAGDGLGVERVRGTNAGWTGSTVLSSTDWTGGAHLGDV
jgi:hypothetical protein